MSNRQPQAQAGMSVRDVKNLPYDKSGEREREWTNGLCGCLAAPGDFCCSCFCPCVMYGKNKARLAYLESKGAPLPGSGSVCSGNCCLHACLNIALGLGCLLQIGARGNVRSRYKISGGCCSDCCASMCCGPCALTQESREIELEEDALKR